MILVKAGFRAIVLNTLEKKKKNTFKICMFVCFLRLKHKITALKTPPKKKTKCVRIMVILTFTSQTKPFGSGIGSTAVLTTVQSADHCTGNVMAALKDVHISKKNNKKINLQLHRQEHKR